MYAHDKAADESSRSSSLELAVNEFLRTIEESAQERKLTTLYDNFADQCGSSLRKRSAQENMGPPDVQMGAEAGEWTRECNKFAGTASRFLIQLVQKAKGEGFVLQQQEIAKASASATKEGRAIGPSIDSALGRPTLHDCRACGCGSRKKWPGSGNALA